MYHSEVVVFGGFRNDYGIHQAVWRLFPDDGAAKRDFLYRVAARDRDGRIRLLLQSRRRPRSNAVARVEASDPFPLDVVVAPGPRCFALVANPVKTLSKKVVQRAHGQRKPLTDPVKQRLWLTRKMAEAAELDEVQVCELPPIQFRKPREDFRSGCIRPLLYVGRLRVLDSEKMSRLITEGIGPAKGFGCGLLTLTPPALPQVRAG